jgi:hypothetical protein
VAELFRFRKDGGKLLPFPEYPEERFGFAVRQPDEAEFGEDNGPRKDGEKEENEEDDLHHRAGVKDQVHDAPPKPTAGPGREDLPQTPKRDCVQRFSFALKISAGQPVSRFTRKGQFVLPYSIFHLQSEIRNLQSEI